MSLTASSSYKQGKILIQSRWHHGRPVCSHRQLDHRVRKLLLEKLSPGNAPTRMEVSACAGGSRDWRTRKIGQALERLDPILAVADQVPRHFPLAPERQPQTVRLSSSKMGVMEILFAAIHIRRPVPDVARDRAASTNLVSSLLEARHLKRWKKRSCGERVQGQERAAEGNAFTVEF